MPVSTYLPSVFLVIVVMLSVACGQSASAAESPTISTSGISSNFAPLGDNAQGQQQSMALAAQGMEQGKIHVTGGSAVAVTPDLAFLGVSVDTTSATVSEAREGTAVIMQAVMTALRAAGVEDMDIQTRGLNVGTKSDWQYIDQNGVSVRTWVVVGYSVSNSITVKIRDLDSVGTIIDDTAAAAGNAVSFSGPTFTVEDLSPITDQLRQAAMNDAISQAQHYADLAGVGLGDLISLSAGTISRPTSGGYGYYDYAYQAAPAVGAPVPTSISVGVLTAYLSVNATFAIQ